MGGLNIPPSLRNLPRNKTVFLRGETLAALIDALVRDHVVAGEGLEERAGFTGRVLSAPEPPPEEAALRVVARRPRYVPVPAGEPATGAKRFFVTLGTVNGVPPDNFTDPFDITADTYFFLKVNMSEVSDQMSVTSAEILTGGSYDSEVNAAWGAGGELPAHCIIPLGYVHHATAAIQNFGAGSIQITPAISSITPQADGTTILGRSLAYMRMQGY